MRRLDGFDRRASSVTPERQRVRARQPLLATVGADEDSPFEDIDKPVVSIPKTEGDPGSAGTSDDETP